MHRRRRRPGPAAPHRRAATAPARPRRGDRAGARLGAPLAAHARPRWTPRCRPPSRRCSGCRRTRCSRCGTRSSTWSTTCARSWRSDVPALTLGIGHGASLSENPADGRTFGEHRCALVARAVLDSMRCHHREQVSPRDRRRSPRPASTRSGPTSSAAPLGPALAAPPDPRSGRSLLGWDGCSGPRRPRDVGPSARLAAVAVLVAPGWSWRCPRPLALFLTARAPRWWPVTTPWCGRASTATPPSTSGPTCPNFRYPSGGRSAPASTSARPRRAPTPR